MAKFVKLENGNYINIDHIITISGDYAYTTGFDNDWQAHAERVTKKDVEKILKASEKMNNRWRKIVKLDNSGYEGCAKTESSIMVFNSVFWGTVALDNHTECRTPSFRKGAKKCKRQ